MDVKYIGGDVPWTLPFGDHFNSSSQASFTDTHQTFISASELETIARRHGFEPLYSTNEKQSKTKFPFGNDHLQWMNTGILFTDKTIDPNLTGIHNTDFSDNHGHTFCYLCSINQHHHEPTRPRDQSQRRKLIPYSNPKALRARSSCGDRTDQDSLTSNLIPYRFIVRTCTGKHSGTRAQVFLYIYGTENEWTSVNLRGRTNQTSDGFPSGSIRTFCLKGPDIGQLHHLNVNLVGARSEREWFLKEIEITNLNTSVTWLCEFNCWLPKTHGKEHYEVKPTMVSPRTELSFDNLSVYILQVHTGSKPFAGTDSHIQVMIRGSSSQTRQLPLTSADANLFEQNQLDTFAIVGWDIGELLELTVDSDKAQLAADWDLKEMAIWKILPNNKQKHVQVYFPFNTWLGKKVSTLKAKTEAYPVFDHHPRGPTCYHISIKTGKIMNAGTDANVFIIIYGESGRTTIHHLDNRSKNDFERNTTSEFTIMDMDVGKIARIKIWHDNANIGAAWFLDTVLIRKKHSTCRPITNVFIQRLEQISKVFYNQAREQMTKDHKVRRSSSKENEHRSSDRKSLSSKDYDDLDNNRSILRKGSSKKNVTWDEQSIGSQDERPINDTKRMQNKPTKIEEKRKKDNLSSEPESGHFDHRAYWISSHIYNNNKWQIKSIEEGNSFHLDQSTRTLLLSDRLTINNKIKTPINERDDDVYEFEANRWLAKGENDGKLEVYLTPKSTQLSTHTTNETKLKSSFDTAYDSKTKHHPSSTKTSSNLQHDDEQSKRLSQFDHGPSQRSPRSVTSFDRSPHDTSKTRIDESRESQRSSSTLKRHEESSRSNNDRIIPSASQRDLLAKLTSESPLHPRSAATSLIDTRSTDLNNQRSKSPRNNDHITQSTSERELLARLTGESPRNPRAGVASLIDPRSSDSYGQHSKSPRSNNESTSSPASNRDLSSRIPSELPHNPRSGIASLIDPRSSDLSNQRSKPPRSNNDHIIPSASERELLARLTGESPRNPRSAAVSAIDPRSSDLYSQRAKPSRLNNESTSPPTSNRDLSSRIPSELPHNPRSGIASLIDPRSSDLSNQQSKPPRSNNDHIIPSASERELLARLTGESPRNPRSAAASAIDARSLDLYNQRPKSSRVHNDSTSPPTSNRDLSSRMPPDPALRTTSATQSLIDTSSHRPTRNQVYSSAYGTLPTDDF